ncbi:methyltransferase domain-containing protein [Geitlerinema sp. PCC 7407]|uniref:methyltransferase domain-containing protein n=1 Tax=Geitlerinema sp. PCC 7407 TaxID=1173025 RepID=UPI00029FC88E|nr:methyltransferase domain-containing protein [Geitlerinema sp. PCC 7407]AFY64573.1 Methyltransferase type 11 [Geitlerinema sp. PCC 7407]
MSTPLYQRIQQFYDASSGLWEQTWGEHMHHGYYGPGGKLPKDRRIAQIDLIEELLAWAGVEQAGRILDAGCGIGGSSLYLAAKYGAQVDGVTLSPVQAARATARSREAGFGDRARFQVADALHLPFADDTFDLVWSLESGEHMPDKAAFLQECCRVLKPGGVFILATWCHRPIDGVPLSADEERHLKEIYDVYHLPYVISLPEYEAIARSLPFKELRTADWSAEVAPFWDRVIESAFNPLAIVGLLASGWETIRGALALGLMSQGFERGLIRYGLLRATK